MKQSKNSCENRADVNCKGRREEGRESILYTVKNATDLLQVVNAILPDYCYFSLFNLYLIFFNSIQCYSILLASTNHSQFLQYFYIRKHISCMRVNLASALHSICDYLSSTSTSKTIYMHITRDICRVSSFVKIQSFILSFLVCKPRSHTE